ncbi:MAG: penicillin-binding protein 2 [Lysobacteraceae bacterium]
MNARKTRMRSANFRLRLYVVFGLLALAGGALVVRAAGLQLLDTEFYQRQGDARFLRELPIPVSRGTITDRNGEPLAVSSPVESIWADPGELLQHPDRFPQLAAALSTPLEPLVERIAQRKDKEFLYLRRQMNPDDAAAILELDIPGVYSQREFRRFYPQGDAAAHVIGFTNIDDRGQEGLELAFDDWLTGKPGAKRVIRDMRGAVVENVELVRAPEPGRDLALSIDRRIQYTAYRALGEALRDNDASSGSMVVLDVKSGEILAMVNLPSYNPNARAADNAAARRNRAVTDVFEPGSVVKAFTVAAAMETGRWTPTTPINTHPGTLELFGHTIHDFRDYGVIDVTRLLTKSSNVGATKLSLDMTAAQLFDMLQRFGFGSVTGCGFPGESAGVLPPARGWGTVEKATISYGYGLSVTALQMAQAYAAIGNGGRLVTPTFVHGAPMESRAVIDPRLAETLIGMLETVTGPEGTARRAAVPGYRTAGKSGTSRRAAAGGYEKRYLSLFAGLVPASEPRFATVVMINDPKAGDYYGGLVSAPAFQSVMDSALRLYNVAPDDVDGWLVQQQQLPALGPDGLPPEAEAVPPLIMGGMR